MHVRCGGWRRSAEVEAPCWGLHGACVQWGVPWSELNMTTYSGLIVTFDFVGPAVRVAQGTCTCTCLTEAKLRARRPVLGMEI